MEAEDEYQECLKKVKAFRCARRKWGQNPVGPPPALSRPAQNEEDCKKICDAKIVECNKMPTMIPVDEL